MIKSSIALIAATLCATPALANHHETSQPPMQAEDLITMPRLGSPSVGPDGRYVIYGVLETDADSYAREGVYFLLDLSHEKPQPVKLDLGGSASSVVFGSDSFLYFLSDRRVASDADQSAANSRLWRVAFNASGNIAEPMLVADFPQTSIEGFKISPDGAKIALWAPIQRDCASFGCEGDGKLHLPGPGTGRLYDSADGFIRHWDEWASPGTLNRVFVFDLVNGMVSGKGVPTDGIDPTTGLKGDTPTKPFGGGEDLAWAADSSGIYFVARETGRDEPTSTDLDIYWSDLSGAGPVALTETNTANDNSPAPSPDGRYLAYLAMERPTYESDRQVIMLRDLKSGETRALTDEFDRSFGALAWTPDSRSIIATAGDVLDTPAFRINPRTGNVSRLDLVAGDEAHIGNLTPLAGDRLIFTRDSIAAPAELFLAKGGKKAHAVTDVASSRMGAMAPVTTTRFSFAGANGDEVWGQITRLKDQEGPIPAILYIHGGPQGSFNDGWSSRWNPRVLASQGYAVISVDFHGSTGYGQAFTDSINQDWGGKPLEDLQLGLAAALKLDTQIDGENACAMGASYGGYMVNWIAGKWPNRFKCLIQHDGLFELRSFYGATEELWFPRWDFGGSYTKQAEVYEKWNPANHVENWLTPMLVVTSEKDFRIPYTQGIQSFTVLQEREIPSQLLVFPDENHWVLGAKNSLQWHQTIFSWLDRWLGKHETDE